MRREKKRWVKGNTGEPVALVRSPAVGHLKQPLIFSLIRYLAMLVVDPDYWRQGVGRTLVQWGLHLADASGTSTCFLEASVMAEAFYTKLGFRTLGWDQVQTDVASHDFCRWPYMIRE